MWLLWSHEIIQGQGNYFKMIKNNIKHTTTEHDKTSLKCEILKRNFFFLLFSYSNVLIVVCFSVLQVWWHGAKNYRGEGVWVHMLSEWGAGHRLACPCNSVKLQPYLPPKPAGRETTSPEGTDSPPLPLSVSFSLPLSLSISLYFASICLFPLSLSYPHVTEWQGKHYLPEY